MKCGRPKWMLRQLFQVFFLSILSVLIIAAVLAYLVYFLPASYHPVNLISYRQYHPSPQRQDSGGKSAIISSSAPRGGDDDHTFQDLQLVHLETAPIRHVSKRSLQLLQKQQSKNDWLGGELQLLQGDTSRRKCSMFTCFDIHRCGGQNGSLSVYVYPIYRWVVDGKPVQETMSKEFYQFLEAIRRSPFYVSNPKHACVFVPSIDLLNLNRLNVASEDILTVLSSLEFWGYAGQNHLLLTLFPGNSPLLQLRTNAIVAASGLFVEHFRLGFQIPVISPSPFFFSSDYASSNANNDRIKNSRIAVAVQGAFSFDLLHNYNADNSLLLLDYCHNHKGDDGNDGARDYFVRCSNTNDDEEMVTSYEYPQVLRQFDFCLVIRDLASPVLWEVMSAGCIPVIVADHQRLPFDEIVDWRRNSIQLYEHQLHQLSSILHSVSESRRRRLRRQVQFTFDTYFRNMSQVTRTLLETLQDRVFTHYAKSVHQWNDVAGQGSTHARSPLFNPITAPKEAGFTAVILAYERVVSLFNVIQRVSLVPSLVKIIVVWNNQLKDPPSLDSWPKVGVPVKIIRTKENKMSNRFVPFDEIETEAVFSLDDDIVMLTVDEMEFGFETWREYPDRLVGFPSRSHVWDNATRRWKYESEWTSQISMVLTGAAFYHKYWHFAYTNELSRDIRDWVDAKMNCEDIAMNFLIANRTGKAPIKVSPRKKFKCPSCSNNEMLSADTGHMVERTECINKFVQVMGGMPLIPAEVRGDPVLFKVDGIPNKLKKYHDMGTM